MRLDADQQIDFGDDYRILKYFATPNTMTVQSPGKVAMIIDNNNNGTGEIFQVMKDSQDPSSATELFRVQENGNVGIGTTSPGFLLDVNGDVNIESNLYFDSNAENRIGETGTNTMGVWARNMDIYASDVLTLRSGTAVGDDIIFKTGSTERMRILNNGNVGIGTTSPSYKLHIVDDNATAAGVWIEKSAGSNQNAIYARNTAANGRGGTFQATGASGNKYGVTGMASNGGTNYGGYFDADGGTTDYAIYTNRGDAILGATSGNVGIGTTSPNSTFETNGSFATSAIREVTSSVTLTATDYIIIANSFTGTVTITLPTAVGIKGRKYIIKRTGTNYVYVSAGALEIDGSGSQTLSSNWAWIEVISDGSNWIKIGG